MLDVEVGYVRVSKREQNPELQRRELLAVGCERIFEERISSREESRPQLEAALDYCHRGDVLVAWRLEHLIQDFIGLVNGLKEWGVGFRWLRESWCPTTPGGKLVFHVMWNMRRHKDL